MSSAWINELYDHLAGDPRSVTTLEALVLAWLEQGATGE